MQNDRDSLSDLRGGRHDAIASRRQDPARALRTRRGRLPGLCRIASLSAQIKLLPTDLGGRGAAYETAREEGVCVPAGGLTHARAAPLDHATIASRPPRRPPPVSTTKVASSIQGAAACPLHRCQNGFSSPSAWWSAWAWRASPCIWVQREGAPTTPSPSWSGEITQVPGLYGRLRGG
jgi:hypothetical protein